MIMKRNYMKPAIKVVAVNLGTMVCYSKLDWTSTPADPEVEILAREIDWYSW